MNKFLLSSSYLLLFWLYIFFIAIVRSNNLLFRLCLSSTLLIEFFGMMLIMCVLFFIYFLWLWLLLIIYIFLFNLIMFFLICFLMLFSLLFLMVLLIFIHFLMIWLNYIFNFDDRMLTSLTLIYFYLRLRDVGDLLGIIVLMFMVMLVLLFGLK